MISRPRRTGLCPALAIAAAAVTGIAPAGEAGAGEAYGANGIGDGVCAPEPVIANHLVDCRFPIGDGVTGDLPDGSWFAVIRTTGDRTDWRRSEPCRIDDGELLCAELLAVGQTVALEEPGGDMIDDKARVTFAEVEPAARLAVPILARFPLVAAGAEFSVEVRRVAAPPATPLWVLVRAWPERRLVTGIGPSVADDDSAEGSSLVIEDPGEYELIVCIGPDTATCTPDPSGVRIEAVETLDVDELHPGHNVATADRINLLVIGHHYPHTGSFLAAARTIFDLGGSPLQPPEALIAAGHAGVLWFTPFAAGPLRDNVDKFNFWFAEHVGTLDHRILFNDHLHRDAANVAESVAATDRFGLQNLAVIHLTDGSSPNGVASLPTFAGIAELPPVTDNTAFGQAWVNGIPHGTRGPNSPATPPVVTSHELGHSLFGLTTERPLAPVCAVSINEAESWWGDLVGHIDPYFYEWRQALQDAGQWDPPAGQDPEAEIAVGFRDSAGCVRPTESSLMVASRSPVWGAVDRRRIEAILDRFTGTAPLTTDILDTALQLDCTPNADATLRCTGSLAPYIEPPPGGLRIRSGDTTQTCTAGSPTTDHLTPITCPDLPQPSTTVEAAVADGPWITVAATEAAPTSTSSTSIPTPPLPPPTPTPSTDTTNDSSPTVIAAAITAGALAIVAIGIFILRHRRTRPS